MKLMRTLFKTMSTELSQIDDRLLSNKKYASLYNVKDKKSINVAKELVENGEVIALPTDTVYGLACLANDPKAINYVYKIKGRDENKPIAICVSNIETFRHYGHAEHLSNKLLNILLPGAITIIVEKTKYLNNPYLNPGISKIGIRIPQFQFIQDLCKQLNQPLALTSANKSAEKSSLNVYEFQPLWSHLGGVFDGGLIGLTEESRLASTVVDLSQPGKYEVIRKGISFENTINVLHNFGINRL